MKSPKNFNNPFAPNDLEKDCDDDENIIESYVETLYDTEFQIPSSSQSLKFFVAMIFTSNILVVKFSPTKNDIFAKSHNFVQGRYPLVSLLRPKNSTIGICYLSRTKKLGKNSGKIIWGQVRRKFWERQF
mgnify:CR=1 FL=1